MPSRASAPVLGVVALVFVTGMMGSVVFAVLPSASAGEPMQVTISVEADASTNTVTIRHEGGAVVDLHDVDLHIEIDGVPLKIQPDIPAVNHRGFSSISGPFHAWSSNQWTVGEAGTLAIGTTTNDPAISNGSEVAVLLMRDDVVIAKTVTIAS